MVKDKKFMNAANFSGMNGQTKGGQLVDEVSMIGEE